MGGNVHFVIVASKSNSSLFRVPLLHGDAMVSYTGIVGIGRTVLRELMGNLHPVLSPPSVTENFRPGVGS